MPLPQRQRVFISYSHQDGVWLKRLREQLTVLEREGLIDIFEDTLIGAGDDWYTRLHKEMLGAKLAVLLVSAPFLNSAFIRTEEIPLLFDQHTKGGMKIYPILVRPCPWDKVRWLAPLQIRPPGAKAISSLRGAAREQALADVANEIASLLGPTKQAAADIENAVGAFQNPRLRQPSLEQGERSSVSGAGDMETLFINSFTEYCAHCAKMMSQATAEVRTVQTPSRGVGDSIAFRDYLRVTADKVVLPSGSPTFGVTLYRRLVVVDAASFESEFKKLKVFFEALRNAVARAKKDNVREIDLSCLCLCIVHRETMSRFFHSNLDIHITAANECALAFQRLQTGQEGQESLWQTCLYARLGSQSNADRLIQSYDQVWSQGAILGGEVLAEKIGTQPGQLRAIERTTLTVLRKIAYGHIEVVNPENANVRSIIEKSEAYSNLFFKSAKQITVRPQALAPLVREWHAITRAFALRTPQYVALIAKECQKARGAEQSKRFERALQIASSISAGEFGIGVPISNQIHFRLFSELSSIVGIPVSDLHKKREGTWPETKAVIDLFERSFADLHRGAGVLCTIEVTAFHIVDAMSSLFRGHNTSYIDLHLEIEQSHAELADELCACMRVALDDDDDSEILQGAEDLCGALGRFWGRMADEIFQ